jgi:putative protein-disulfide isomerase
MWFVFNQPHPKIKLYYVTDPICSHCWALEPVLNRIIKQYGQYFKLQVVMGGLLPGWSGFADVSNGIGNSSDVAGHRGEVGAHSRMPIDGTLWYDNPVMSSYPPSRVFKLIQGKDEQQANVFLRRAREVLFAFNQNIEKEDVLVNLVNEIGQGRKSIVSESQLDSTQELLEQDFELARRLGVRGFPTIIMINEENKGVKVVGTQPFETYVRGLEQIMPEKIQAKSLPALSSLLEENTVLFSKEILGEMYLEKR